MAGGGHCRRPAKLEVQRLLRPVLQVQGLRLVCLEGEMPDLLAELAAHKLDVVLLDHPAPFNPRFSRCTTILWGRRPAWAGMPRRSGGRRRRRLPASLQLLLVLLPTTHSIVRSTIDQWLAQKGLRPRVVGEFEDNAPLEALAAPAWGVPGAVAVQDELRQRCQVRLVGACDGVEEHYYAISTERKVAHPLVQLLLQRPRG